MGAKDILSWLRHGGRYGSHEIKMDTMKANDHKRVGEQKQTFSPCFLASSIHT